MRRRIQNRHSSRRLIDTTIGMSLNSQGLHKLITYKFTKLQKISKNFSILTDYDYSYEYYYYYSYSYC